MTCFGELLLEARTRARLTQKELAMKVDVHDTYISKMETGAESPPSRKVALELAAALGIRKKSRRWLDFLLVAGVASAEDMEGFALVEEGNDQTLKSGSQVKPRTLSTIADPAMDISDSLGVTGEIIEYLIASAHLSEEEEKHIAGEVIEFTKRLLALGEALRKREDG